MLSLNFFRELEQLPREFDSVFRGTELDRLLNRSGLPCFTASSSLQVNLREDDDNIYVEALVPGVDPTQIEMTMLEDTLTLAHVGQDTDLEGPDRRWLHRERSGSDFHRTIKIPVAVDTDKITAAARHGVLSLVLPKAVAAKPKKIMIKAQ